MAGSHGILCDALPSRATNETRIPHTWASVRLVTLGPKPVAATKRNSLRHIAACCDKWVCAKGRLETLEGSDRSEQLTGQAEIAYQVNSGSSYRIQRAVWLALFCKLGTIRGERSRLVKSFRANAVLLFPLSFLVMTQPGESCAATIRWAGKKVMVKKDDVKLFSSDQTATQVVVGRANRVLHVEEDRGKWLRVSSHGVSGWLSKKDALLVDDAVPYFSKQLQHHPRDPWLYTMRGIARLDQKDYERAMRDLDEGIRIDPTKASSFQVRGAIHFVRKEYGQAIKDFSEAIRLDPKDPDGFSNRGLAQQTMGDFRRAIRDFDVAIQLDPKNTEFLNGRGYARALMGDYDRAIEDYTAALVVEPKNVNVLLNRARAYGERGRLQLAIQDLDQAILDPKCAAALTMRGFIGGKLGAYRGALADLDAAIRLDPESVHALNCRGRIHEIQNRFGLAHKDYFRASRLAPDDATSLDLFAWLLATCPNEEFRDGERALVLASRACERSSWKEPDFIETLAAAFAESGDFEQALKWQKKAIASFGEARDGTRSRLRAYEQGQPYRGAR
jgi:tetratricopeptide (TPR) repeat protein